jgi:RTX calcium-binding nonapeptide repeat (4 copies)
VSRLVSLLAVVALFVFSATALADVITGTDGNDTDLRGTAGDDVISGLAGNDRITGLAGNDVLDGGPGSDDLAGGSGRDAVSYATSAGAVEVTIDDLANDGQAGEQDNVQTDVEDLFGGPGPDRLTGSAGANTIDGGGGDDRIVGGAGTDALFGGDGDDRIESLDGRTDRVECGAGDDGVIADEQDLVDANCEIVDRRKAKALADATVRHFWAAGPTFTTVETLIIKDSTPASANIDLRCSGRGCPFTRRSHKVGGNGKPVNLTRLFKRARLRVGTRIEVRVTAPDRIGKVVRFTMRSSKLPSRRELCLPAGSSKPRSRC